MKQTKNSAEVLSATTHSLVWEKLIKDTLTHQKEKITRHTRKHVLQRTENWNIFMWMIEHKRENESDREEKSKHYYAKQYYMNEMSSEKKQ